MRGDDARQGRIALVRDQEPAQRHLRGAHVLDVDGQIAERRVEDALLQTAHRACLEYPEKLALELGVGRRIHDQGQPRGDHRDQQCDRHHRPEQPQCAHARRLERDDLQVARQPPAREQHGDQESHREGVGQERGQHENQQLHDQIKGHALRDYEIGEVVDPVDDQEKGEEGTGERER